MRWLSRARHAGASSPTGPRRFHAPPSALPWPRRFWYVGRPREIMSESDGQRGDGAPDSSEDRRGDPRHFACFPAHIQRPGGSTRMALIHDLSVSGALLYTRSRLAVGDTIPLSLYLRENAT